jgi:hypothetical protein
MKLGDPDTYVQWTRCEDPGENPTWESQCGIIEQFEFGDVPAFRGFVGAEKTPVKKPTTTFASIRHIVEKEFQRTHHLEWAYDDD